MLTFLLHPVVIETIIAIIILFFLWRLFIWKKTPYWLKFGIIAELISLISLFILPLIPILNLLSLPIYLIVLLPKIFIPIGLRSQGVAASLDMLSGPSIYIQIYCLAFWFLLASLYGYARQVGLARREKKLHEINSKSNDGV